MLHFCGIPLYRIRAVTLCISQGGHLYISQIWLIDPIEGGGVLQLNGVKAQHEHPITPILLIFLCRVDFVTCILRCIMICHSSSKQVLLWLIKFGVVYEKLTDLFDGKITCWFPRSCSPHFCWWVESNASYFVKMKLYNAIYRYIVSYCCLLFSMFFWCFWDIWGLYWTSIASFPPE